VYLAEDTLLGREVALAVIKADGLDEIAKARFTREAQDMARLGSHPHIVTIFDLGCHEDEPYLVTEVLRGGSVADVMENAPGQGLSIQRTIAIAKQVCKGLEFAHSEGIIHRDLKPGNIWLTADGTVKIGDLGMAVALDRSRLTLEPTMVGTVAYVSPEQAMGGEVTPRSDLYSLGAMLYEMVTGRPPFMADNPLSIISQHVNLVPVAPSLNNPQCPQRLEAIILGLLAKDPAKRPQSAAAVLSALESVDDTREIEPNRQPSDLTRVWRNLTNGVFVGRDREMAELKTALDDALSGQGKVVLLAGEPGIGKTRAVHELATYAALRGAEVFLGRCYEEQGTVPYSPWLQIMQSYMPEQDSSQLNSNFGTSASNITTLLYELQQQLPGRMSAPTQEIPEQAQHHLFASITEFFKDVASSRLPVLIFDDLQWADRPSLLLLEFVARALCGSRLLVLGTYRDVELSRRHPLSQTLAELTREQLLHRISLQGLGMAEVGCFIEKVAGIAPPPDLVEAVYRRTEGSPLFMTEVVRTLAREGRLTPEYVDSMEKLSITLPEGVSQVIWQRLNRLSQECNQALIVASVIGREFGQKQLSWLIDDVSEDHLLEMLEEALAARVIEESPNVAGRFRFTHPFIQETLSQELSLSRRVRLHARISQALETLHGTVYGSHSAEIAYHLSEAVSITGQDKLVRYSLMAGEWALGTFSPDEALGHFQRALSAKGGSPSLGTAVTGTGNGHCPKLDDELADALFGLGRAQLATLERHQMADAVASLSRALDYYVECRDASRAVAIGEYPIPPLPGQSIGMSQLVARALALIPHDSHQAGGLLSRYGSVMGIEGNDYEGAQEAFGRALHIAHRDGDLLLEIRTLTESATVDIFHLNLRRSLQGSQRAIERARGVDDSTGEMHGNLNASLAMILVGDGEGARRHIDSGLAIAEKQNNKFWLATGYSIRQTLVRLQGDWEAARSCSEQGLSVAPGDPRLLGIGALSEYEAGEFGQGQLLLNRLVDAMRGAVAGPNYEYTYVAAIIPAIARLTGDTGHLEIAETVAEAVISSPSAPPYLVTLARIGLGMIAVIRGDGKAASQQYTALDSLRGTLPAADGIVCTDRLLGLLAQTQGRLDEAMAHFEEAMTFCRGAGYLPEYAWSAMDYADALKQRNSREDRAKAVELLEEAMVIARRLEMAPLVERVTSHSLYSQATISNRFGNSIRVIASSVTVERPDLYPHSSPDGTVTILFSDIENYTAMTERLGDQRMQQVLRAHNAMIRQQVAAHQGFEVKSLGDGFMLAFSSARRALQCAIAIQRAFAHANIEEADERLRVRIGLHTGEVIKESEDLYGKNVILASRIAGQACGGQILASSVLKSVMESGGDIEFGEGMDVCLKGLAGTNRLHEVLWE